MINRALSGGEGGSKKSHKRKRPAEKAPGGVYEKREQVRATQENLERLMKKVAGGAVAGAKGKGGKGGKRQARPLSPIAGGDVSDGDGDMDFGNDEPEKPQTPIKKKKTKAVPVGLDGRPLHPPAAGPNSANAKPKKQPPKQEQKKATESQESDRPSKKTKLEQQSTSVAPTSASPTASPAKPLPTPTAAAVALTPLQATLTTSLQSAKFRWLNEQLYTRDSKDAVGLMRGAGGDKEAVGGAFHEYHESHRHLTSHWPSPPLEHITSAILSLPARTDGYLIVDLGCGDAGLARSVAADGANGKGKRVMSFDLVGDVEVKAEQGDEKGWVVPVDFLTMIPLPGDPGGRASATDEVVGSSSSTSGAGKKKKRALKAEANRVASDGRPEVVDVAVCCLSLMGINWVGGVYEACRVLRRGGTLHIAEVTSRLVSKDFFISLICSFGFELEEHTTPTTHFDLFRFVKTSSWPMGVVKGQNGWDTRVKSGEKVLKGCVYKKR